MTQEDRERYLLAAHAMQSGVAADPDPNDKTPKHLRVGVNAAMSDQGGLVALLIGKGVFTADEYEKAIADAMEREAERYKRYLSEKFGKPVNLA